jgi:GDP-L-fucose synthase
MPSDPPFPLRDKTIWVAGETGMVGRALSRALIRLGYKIVSAPRNSIDLTQQTQTHDWMMAHRPDVIFMAAAKVGGIGANNNYPADFICDNLAIAQNVIDSAHRAGVQKLMFLGSSCIYPRDAVQPLRESALMTGRLEPTNEPYAMAKLAGISMCAAYRRQYGCRFISVLPTNLYGPFDRFDENAGHVIPAMIKKLHTAKQTGAPHVTLWGTGKPMREFMHVDDLADSLIHVMQHYDDGTPINIGSGQEHSIMELAVMIKHIIGYEGDIVFDPAHPDGTPRKRLDLSLLDGLGWRASIDLKDGLKQTYAWYCEHIKGAN